DSVDRVLVKDSDVAVSHDVQLERFELEAELVRHVTNREMSEIGKVGLGADRVVLGNLDGDLVVRVLVRPGLNRRKRRVDAGAGVLFVVILRADIVGVRRFWSQAGSG